jgi:NAD(P)-dependent dehydrogenase (short-subunit alcohol dehydrogenase family)
VNRMTGKVAVVTGGASGIGRATALLLAREGASVVVGDVNGPVAESAVDDIESAGGSAISLAMDIGDEASVRAAFERTLAEYGRVDVVCNVAADTSLQAMMHDTPVHEMTIEAWDRAMQINLRGTMLSCKHALRSMMSAGGGSIVNLSSNQGLTGDLAQTAYSCAKAAIVQLTRSVATQYGRFGIRANTVSPGAVRTPAFERLCPPEVAVEVARHNLGGRIGEPEDLANTILFLASDEAAYLTGQLLVVDGGQLAHLPTYAFLVDSALASTHQ